MAQNTHGPTLIGFYCFVHEFRIAVKLAEETPRVSLTSATYYLLCLTIELGLRASLQASGVSAGTLNKQYGHDLAVPFFEAGWQGLQRR